jgi:hypothetical protein
MMKSLNEPNTKSSRVAAAGRKRRGVTPSAKQLTFVSTRVQAGMAWLC